MKIVVAVSAVLIAATAAGIGLGHLAARFLPSSWFDAELLDEVVTNAASLADVADPGNVVSSGALAGVANPEGTERLLEV